MKTAFLLLASLMICMSASAQETLTGDITDHMDSVISSMPGATPQGAYLQPASSSRTIWRSAIQAILAGDYYAADTLVDPISYRVVEFTDNSGGSDKVYYILERSPGSTSRYWGTFVFNPNPMRPKLVIECPHSSYDRNTGYQGFHAFFKSGARACFFNGTHRCNGLTSSSCDGSTSACSEAPEAYPYSDQAHVVLSTFQITTEEMLSVIPDMVVIQPHGYGQDTGDPDMIMSNGSRYTPIDDYLLQLRDNLLAQDASLTFKVAHIDLTWTKLIARTNVQGRLLNNCSDPCGTYATETTGRFLHLEQAYSGLRDTEANWDKLANAIIATFPPLVAFASAQSGSWTDPDTWAGGTVPTSDDDVLIVSGHTVSVDDLLAECRSLSFGGDDALIDMNAKSNLSIYGDMTLFSESHNAFSAGWSSDSAFVRFVGGDTQTLSGWSTTGSSTSFRDAIIEKDSGSVIQTSGVGMRLCFQNSLEIISGILNLEPGDDIEARWTSSGNSTNNQTLEITVHANGELMMINGDGTHFLRSGTGSSPVGPMTVYGTVEFVDASSYDISVNGITVGAGGQVNISTGLGSSTYGPEFNPGTITVDSGGALYCETTSDVWFDTSVVILNRGGTYKTTSSTTVFPPTFVNDGRVRYQRNPSTATTDQQVVDTNYYDLEFSFAGNDTKKTWTLAGDRNVSDSLEVNNSAELVLTAASAQTLTIDSTLRLTSGLLDNSDANVTIELGDGSLISRATGAMTSAPSFAGVANVRYTSTAQSVTTGPELPVSPLVLRDLQIAGNKGVYLGADATVNGELHLSDSLLWTNGHTLTLSDVGTIVEDSIWVVQGRIKTSRTLSQSITEEFGGLGLELTAAGASPGLTGMARVTGSGYSAGDSGSIERLYEITPAVNTGLDATAVFSYAVSELNGLTAPDLGVYRSTNGGSSWESLGGTVDTLTQTVTLTGLDEFGWFTLAESSGGCCGVFTDGSWPTGYTGNTNCTSDGKRTLSDITKLIDHVYISKDPLCCYASGNTNGSLDCKLTLSDITMLIDAVYISKQLGAACLPACEQ